MLPGSGPEQRNGAGPVKAKTAAAVPITRRLWTRRTGATSRQQPMPKESRSKPRDPAPAKAAQPPANALWGGRFSGGPAAIMAEINASIAFDQRLWQEEIQGSKAHAAMLAQQKIISSKDAAAILDGLDRIAAEIEAGNFPFRVELKDIHMNVEARLAELIGKAAGGCTPRVRATTRSRPISGSG